MFFRIRDKIIRKRLAARTEWLPMRRFLMSAPPDPQSNWRDVPLLALDLETTGLEARENRIVSMGWVLIQGGRIQMDQGRHLVIQSAAPMDQSATIHGIFDRHLATGIPLQDAMAEFLDALAGKVLVLHHAPLDMAFLNQALRSICGRKLVIPTADTMALERARLDRRGQPIADGMLRLGEARKRYGLPSIRAHNALTDALATAELLLAISAYWEKGGNALPLKRLLARR